MSNRKGKLPPVGASSLVMRSVAVRSETANSTARSVRVVTATETPVERFDDKRGVFSEVLLMSGIEMRAGRTSIPIVDSHDSTTVRNVLGSLRGLTIVGGEFGGEAVFANDTESQSAYAKLVEGHLTDFSITAIPHEVLEVRPGQSYTTSTGEVIQGPADIVTRWTPIDASLVACGADEMSTVRRSYEIPTTEKRTMDEALLGQLKELGLPDGMTDPNQVLAWVVGKIGAPAEEAAPVENNMDEEQEPIAKAEEAPAPTEEEKPAVATEEEIKNAVSRALKADHARRREIQAACKAVGIERAIADQLCEEGISVDVARARILERMATTPLGQSADVNIRVTASEEDKFYGAARDGLLLRAQKSAGVKRSLIDGSKPADGAEDFRYQSLSRIAESFARQMGAPVERMAPKDIALVAMGHAPTLNRLRIQRSDSAYHTTGSFANLLLDAANKTLLAGYEEVPVTWDMWARTASSVPDFKNINRIRFSESPDLEMVPELGDYKEGTMSDSKESYKVEKFGKMFSVSWETVINDDLDAISRIPAMQGAAARRTQNRKVYEVLTSNPTMGDGNPLFSSSHTSGDNTSGAAAAPSVTTLNAAFVKMRLQKGLNATVTLNLSPKYLIVPVAYEATAMELFSSISYNAANNNEGVKNIYGAGGQRNLTLISDPVLDASSSTTWYLAADTSQIDTIELAFLQGEESPVLENEWDFDKDAYRYKIRQTFGVKAIDWRGLYKNSA
jgi:hypothetical protein